MRKNSEARKLSINFSLHHYTLTHPLIFSAEMPFQVKLHEKVREWRMLRELVAIKLADWNVELRRDRVDR